MFCSSTKVYIPGIRMRPGSSTPAEESAKIYASFQKSSHGPCIYAQPICKRQTQRKTCMLANNKTEEYYMCALRVKAYHNKPTKHAVLKWNYKLSIILLSANQSANSAALLFLLPSRAALLRSSTGRGLSASLGRFCPKPLSILGEGTRLWAVVAGAEVVGSLIATSVAAARSRCLDAGGVVTRMLTSSFGIGVGRGGGD
jgi:hypothetical protein